MLHFVPPLRSAERGTGGEVGLEGERFLRPFAEKGFCPIETGTRIAARATHRSQRYSGSEMRKHLLKVALARDHRHEPTAAEAAAWALLRNRRCLGLKFRRQHVVRGFIVDFFCPELRLAVEVDGAVHSGWAQADYDEARSRALALAGISVVRIRNEQVSEAGLIALLAPHVTASPSPRTSPPVPLSALRRGGTKRNEGIVPPLHERGEGVRG